MFGHRYARQVWYCSWKPCFQPYLQRDLSLNVMSLYSLFPISPLITCALTHPRISLPFTNSNIHSILREVYATPHFRSHRRELEKTIRTLRLFARDFSPIVTARSREHVRTPTVLRTDSPNDPLASAVPNGPPSIRACALSSYSHTHVVFSQLTLSLFLGISFSHHFVRFLFANTLLALSAPSPSPGSLTGPLRGPWNPLL